ncbi:MAG: N-acetyltransferase [Aquificaceae bacterium]
MKYLNIFTVVNTRKALPSDAGQIYSLVNYYAPRGILLGRSLSSIYENIRDFWVVDVQESILGCCALHIVWEDLAEIKSLAVKEEHYGKGIGSALIIASLKEASELGIKKVFVLTYAVSFFERFGFKIVEKSFLPHKVWGECVNCVKFPSCDEVAMILEVKECSFATL